MNLIFMIGIIVVADDVVILAFISCIVVACLLEKFDSQYGSGVGSTY